MGTSHTICLCGSINQLNIAAQLSYMDHDIYLIWVCVSSGQRYIHLFLLCILQEPITTHITGTSKNKGSMDIVAQSTMQMFNIILKYQFLHLSFPFFIFDKVVVFSWRTAFCSLFHTFPIFDESNKMMKKPLASIQVIECITKN